MEIAPIIKDDGLTRFELDLDLELFGLQNSGPFPRGFVPSFHRTERWPSLRVAVVIVPSDQPRQFKQIA